MRKRWVAGAVLLWVAGCAGPADAPGDGQSVSGNGITLTSVSETPPAETEALPAGPGQEVVVANCTACHSAAMIAAQPALTPEQWTATVKKMREVYKAQIAEADVPAILAYLDTLGGAGDQATRPASTVR